MPWPQPTDYNEAIQNPHLAFQDADLRRAEPAVDALGLPRPLSGNFADVYQVQGADGQAWAVKCFTRPVRGLHQRYKAVSEHLHEHALPFMVDFQYLEEGIRIRGAWFPVLKMRWVEGLTLNDFLREYADKPPVLERLARLWVRLAHGLRAAGIAHGDLQHGNVLLIPSSKASALGLRLIDYDGMFVPALAESKSGEVGHPNYQHPQRLREETYGPHVDRFSHLVIFAALRCLAAGGRALWDRYDRGENLLLHQRDYLDPERSPLLAELRGHKDQGVGVWAEILTRACRCPLDNLPALDDIVPLEDAPAAEETRPTPARPTEDTRVEAAVSEPTAELKPRATLPPPPETADPPAKSEQHQAAVGQFEYAKKMIDAGNLDYAVQLLGSCVKLDPANHLYRHLLRRTQKLRRDKGGRSGWLAGPKSWGGRAKLKTLLKAGDYLKVLEQGEELVAVNPADVATHLDMAEAAGELGFLDLAIWILEQARHDKPGDLTLTLALARACEKRGRYGDAVALWAIVRKAEPDDVEAAEKVLTLAASETIARGGYEQVVGRKGGA